ncbi:ergothioneine biosynthesis PLP-dependent enzyme EgtE [Mycolicibacterium duvalii]|uniref:Probable hercynylcysteine sulfoxide lyase n=1 Tax=Mycolicibacterium duvalii TaxID=39688 RepID=A0A7I7K752_9MYCO|nr:ergothioneine biosynthesis PLP-dependent enzyme EgtE [Mycolicibacterium duvalii]MCV7368237.1 ergothioneine biosynthesis PLP-dependent enzyme EgtE [Mycolicibacterium duvalii]PEG43291.1 ergothioneine biosynthesis PLP-dependent enzyme EgtE [Mycolicibacterium duvalii]BBX19893.1 putative hercynylcysteine sulfoxide lyase [Mycolicibacterium duvalii]
MSLAERWRSARPPVAGVHLDSAACSRQSLAAIDAAASHARHEAEVGGYVAAEAAAPTLDAGRAAVRALTAMADAEVFFTTGSGHALDILLGSWTGGRTIACLPGEYGPNLASMARHGFDVRELPVDGAGRLDVDAAAGALAENPPALLHLTVLGSHRGTVQPVREIAAACRAAGIPLFVDAAQAFAHLDCASIGADALYSSSRKWTAGPRGVGLLATRPGLLPELEQQRLGHVEVNVGLHVGLCVALGELLALGPADVRTQLCEVGALTRTVLGEVAGWQVIEHVDEPSAITTLYPPDGVDPLTVRARLIAEHSIVTTYVGTERAPREMSRPALRISPHVDVTDDDLATLAAALVAVGR